MNNIQIKALPQTDSIKESKFVDLSEKIDQTEEVSNIQIKALPQTDSLRESTIVDLNESQPPSLIVSNKINDFNNI